MPNSKYPSCSHALLLLALACGDDADQADAAVDANVARADANVSRPSRYEATLVAGRGTDASMFTSVPHQVSFLDLNGNLLDPPVSTWSGPQGEVSLELPANAVSIYVIGVGPVEDDSSTYDTVVVENNWQAGDGLLRISSRGTLDVVEQSANFVARQDRAALFGAIYWTTNGVRRGTVGCAKVYLDGAQEADEGQAQRYLGTVPLPVPLAESPQTSRLGLFYFGNIKVGVHSLQVSTDDRQSFIGNKSFVVARTRAGAQSPTKSLLYQLSIDIEANADPTPASCPSLPPP